MSVTTHMRQTIVFRRPVASQDGHGADVVHWQEPETTIGRLVIKTQARIDDALAEDMTASQYLLLIPRSCAMQQGWRVDQVLDNGVVVGGPFRVVQRLPRKAASTRHISLELAPWS